MLKITAVNPNKLTHVTGSVDNYGTLFDDDAGDKVSIFGTLTNEGGGDFSLNGLGNAATISGGVNNSSSLLNGSASFSVFNGSTAGIGSQLTNSGFVDVENGSKLTINGTVDNFGLLETNVTGLGGNSTVTVTGLLTNESTGQFILNGPGDVANLDGGWTNMVGSTMHAYNGSSSSRHS